MSAARHGEPASRIHGPLPVLSAAGSQTRRASSRSTGPSSRTSARGVSRNPSRRGDDDPGPVVHDPVAPPRERLEQDQVTAHEYAHRSTAWTFSAIRSSTVGARSRGPRHRPERGRRVLKELPPPLPVVIHRLSDCSASKASR